MVEVERLKNMVFLFHYCSNEIHVFIVMISNAPFYFLFSGEIINSLKTIFFSKHSKYETESCNSYFWFKDALKKIVSEKETVVTLTFGLKTLFKLFFFLSKEEV